MLGVSYTVAAYHNQESNRIVGVDVWAGDGKVAGIWTYTQTRWLPRPHTDAVVFVLMPEHSTAGKLHIDRAGNVLAPDELRDRVGNLGWLLDLAMEAGLEIDDPVPATVVDGSPFLLAANGLKSFILKLFKWVDGPAPR